jgi:hypothetical protein
MDNPDLIHITFHSDHIFSHIPQEITVITQITALTDTTTI